jgi:hypothetical protein
MYDDGKHDGLFVQHCLCLHWQHVVDGGFRPTQNYVWCDGCTSQFKSTWPFYFVSRYPNINMGCGMLWSWEVSTWWGKGYGEACIAGKAAKLTWAFSTKCRCYSVTKIGHVASSYPSMSRCLLKRVFWHIKEINVDRDNQWVAKTLIGTHQIYWCILFQKGSN